MCFGIRISSPFHLATQIVPIQNPNCPKNAKNACADMNFIPALPSEAVSSLLIAGQWRSCTISVLLNLLFCMKITSQSGHPGSQCTYEPARACQRAPSWSCKGQAKRPHASGWPQERPSWPLAFLGQLRLWVDTIWVARCNRLEILIPKHMWKSKIRLLEQKLDENR